MEGFDNLVNLAVLNLADNMLTKIENLSNCSKLDNLYLARNRIGRDGLDDLTGLLDCPSITSLDIQGNKIDDPEVLPEILMKMPELKVLYLQNNPVCKKIKNYRKTIINAIPGLRYLDDRPVFDDDRRHAEAFCAGGITAEREERELINKEKKEKHENNMAAFRAMIAKARADKKA